MGQTMARNHTSRPTCSVSGPATISARPWCAWAVVPACAANTIWAPKGSCSGSTPRNLPVRFRPKLDIGGLASKASPGGVLWPDPDYPLSGGDCDKPTSAQLTADWLGATFRESVLLGLELRCLATISAAARHCHAQCAQYRAYQRGSVPGMLAPAAWIDRDSRPKT
jgi:hypothetical protein